MAIFGKDKDFARNAEIVTLRYRGPNRRDDNQDDTLAEVAREVRQDDKGNPVLDMRTNASRRRKDDDTIDLLKCLDAEDLEVEE